jgi:hypothetical protein
LKINQLKYIISLSLHRLMSIPAENFNQFCLEFLMESVGQPYRPAFEFM